MVSHKTFFGVVGHSYLSVFIIGAMTSGESLRTARMRRGLTQDDVAERFGISRVSVSKWEQNGPPESRLPELAELLGVTIDELRPRPVLHYRSAPVEQVGNAISRRRSALGWSVHELAEKAGVLETQAERWDRTGEVDKYYLPRMAEALGASVEELIAEGDEDLRGAYVKSEHQTARWRDIMIESDLPPMARMCLAGLPYFLDADSWFCAVTTTQLAAKLKLEESMVAEQMPALVGSEFVERFGEVEWLFRLKFPV